MWEAVTADTGARISELLKEEGRAADFSVSFDGMLFDYSKTAMSKEARALLLSIAQSHRVEERRAAMFAGEKDVKKAVMGIVTDSTPMEDPKEPVGALFELYALFANEAERGRELQEEKAWIQGRW